uniref:Uncharacterized protein n=1 Tax=Arundo donax TaxID=35708 RepID=A0A0A9D744_ARUDO
MLLHMDTIQLNRDHVAICYKAFVCLVQVAATVHFHEVLGYFDFSRSTGTNMRSSRIL